VKPAKKRRLCCRNGSLNRSIRCAFAMLDRTFLPPCFNLAAVELPAVARCLFRISKASESVAVVLGLSCRRVVPALVS